MEHPNLGVDWIKTEPISFAERVTRVPNALLLEMLMARKFWIEYYTRERAVIDETLAECEREFEIAQAEAKQRDLGMRKDNASAFAKGPVK